MDDTQAVWVPMAGCRARPRRNAKLAVRPRHVLHRDRASQDNGNGQSKLGWPGADLRPVQARAATPGFRTHASRCPGFAVDSQ